MYARIVSVVAIVFLSVYPRCLAQPISHVDVIQDSTEEILDEVEKRYTPELIEKLEIAKEDALLLYTEYSSRSAGELKIFLKDISSLSKDMMGRLDQEVIDNAPKNCRSELSKRLKSIEFNAHRAATFSAENHHKFFQGHSIVFRMHLNRSEEYIKKCQKALEGCGITCERTPKLIRWRRIAANELSRVREDIEHSRKSYQDLLKHAVRRLKSLKKLALVQANEALTKYDICVKS